MFTKKKVLTVISLFPLSYGYHLNKATTTKNMPNWMNYKCLLIGGWKRDDFLVNKCLYLAGQGCSIITY